MFFNLILRRVNGKMVCGMTTEKPSPTPAPAKEGNKQLARETHMRLLVEQIGPARRTHQAGGGPEPASPNSTKSGKLTARERIARS